MMQEKYHEERSEHEIKALGHKKIQRDGKELAWSGSWCCCPGRRWWRYIAETKSNVGVLRIGHINGRSRKMLPYTAKKTKCFDIYILMISLWFCGARVNSRVHMDTCWLKYSFNVDNPRVSPGTEAGRRDSPWVLEPCCSGAGWSLLGFGVSRAGHTDPTMWAKQGVLDFHTAGPCQPTPAPLLYFYTATFKASWNHWSLSKSLLQIVSVTFRLLCLCGRKVGCWYSWFIFAHRGKITGLEIPAGRTSSQFLTVEIQSDFYLFH